MENGNNQDPHYHKTVSFLMLLYSSQVLKNGVRLSSNLSNTMGCPASGRTIFVHFVQNTVRAGLFSGTEKPQSTKDCLLVFDCKELNLELVHSNSRLTMNSTSTNLSAEKSLYRPENGVLVSPKTPLNQSKLSYSNSSPLLHLDERSQHQV